MGGQAGKTAGDCPPGRPLSSAQEPLKPKAPRAFSLSQLRCINTSGRAGGISHGIFLNHSNVSFPIVCSPSTVKAVTGTAAPPGPDAHLRSASSSPCWEAGIGGTQLGQGIRSVRQLVRQSSGGNMGWTQPTLLGTQLCAVGLGVILISAMSTASILWYSEST